MAAVWNRQRVIEGPADDVNEIRPPSETGFTIPPNASVIRVTVAVQ